MILTRLTLLILTTLAGFSPSLAPTQIDNRAVTITAGEEDKKGFCQWCIDHSCSISAGASEGCRFKCCGGILLP